MPILLSLLRFWQIGVGAVIGAFLGYQAGHFLGVGEGKRVEREAAIARTEKAINEVNDDAQKARAMRVHCRSIGRLYSFATGKCGETIPSAGDEGDRRD